MRRARIQFARSHHFGGVEYCVDFPVAEIELPQTLTAQRLESCIRNGVATIVPIESEVTSPAVASTAGRILVDDEASVDAKSVAGSALAQSAPRKGRRSR